MPRAASPRHGWLTFLPVALLATGLCAWIGQLGPPGATTPTVSRTLVLPPGGLILLLAALWISMLLATLLLPKQVPLRHSTGVIVVLAVLCRALLLPHPVSDDVNHALWEGRLLAAGLNSSSQAPRGPDDSRADHLRSAADPYRPEMTAICPPLKALGFALVAVTWYSPLAIKLVTVACDLATVLLLLLLLRDRRLDPRWALLYALNPVSLYSFAGLGHPDAVQVVLLTGALWLYRRRRWRTMFLLLGLAAQANYLALFVWPLFLRRRENLRQAWIAPVAALAPVVPFHLADGTAVFANLLRSGHSHALDGPLHWLLRVVLGDIVPAAVVCQILLVPVCLTCWWLNHPQRRGSRAGDPVNGLIALLGASLLLSPTVPFRYLPIIISFVAVRPSLSWLVLSGTIALTFVAPGHLHLSGQFLHPWWAMPAVWLVPLLLLLRELHLVASRCRADGSWPEPRTVSVVIPARNEAERLGDCLGALGHSSSVSEVIVVDGGSDDDTRREAESAGATVIEHAAPITDGGGRGGQIAAGCRQATGDLVAVVHADTRLTPGILDRARSALARNPDAVGATLGAQLDAPGVKLRLLEVCNDLRAAFLGISFGDQVQIFRRRPVMELDRYPSIPLMEDVELGLRLLRLGRVLFLWERAQVSARRWRSGSRWKSIVVNALVAEYLLRRVAGRPDTVAMYRRYYGGDEPRALQGRETP